MNLPYDEREDRRRRIQRNMDDFKRQTPELFDSTEKFGYQLDRDGLGVWIYIQSGRATNTFEMLSRSVFQGLTPQYHDEGGRHWARFGYSHSKSLPFLEPDSSVTFCPPAV